MDDRTQAPGRFDSLRQAVRRATSDRALRAFLQDCQRLLTERGEANSLAIAHELLQRWPTLPAPQQAAFFDSLLRDFGPDPQTVLTAAQRYASQPDADSLASLIQAAEPPRQELLRRLNRAPGGTSTIIAMRRLLLANMAAQPELRAVEADFLHLLSSWFNPGFLEVQRVDWNSPAQLLEKIIQHEAVHAIDGWDDLRRRLQPDRRCFAFFHPQLPGEPLIFVEVALLPEMPAEVAPILDKRSTPLPADQFEVAVFYSISNCQPGLRNVSLGNFLIKRVAERLMAELPGLRRFCTLSPIPGFAGWLRRRPVWDALSGVGSRSARSLGEAHARVLAACDGNLDRLTPDALRADAPAAEALQRLCAAYLVHESATPNGDPVARFHLHNGARLERLNPLADLSRKGVRQSFGMMVNYLYDLKRIEANHEKFAGGEVAHARGVAALL